MVAGIGYGGPRQLIPILMESGEVDGLILLGGGWVYTMLDSEGFKIDFDNVEDEQLRQRLERDKEYCKELADYALRWGKPLIITSPVAGLVIRRRYPGLVYLLDQDIMLYPTIDDAVLAFSALAERYHFLEREGFVDRAQPSAR